MSRIIQKTAQEKDLNRKLKYFVRGDMQISYNQFSSLKATGGLSINGRTARANDLLAPGDLVRAVLPDDHSPERILPMDAPVEIAYEDDDLIIIDKPAPLPCQHSDRQSASTLENRLAFRYGPEFLFRPVNRLDKGTSGLMAAAKNAYACHLLQKQLHTPQFLREYLAVVEGAITGEGEFDFPIIKENAPTIRRVVDFENGKPSVTRYRAEGCFYGKSLVRLILLTGRTHQIRVHLAYVGHPIVGDFLYGREDLRIPGRFALHSTRIALNHPITGAQIERVSPLPAELLSLLK